MVNSAPADRWPAWHQNHRLREGLFQWLLGLGMGGLALFMILPMLYVVAVSFTDPSVYHEGQLILWPARWSLAGYRYVLAGQGFWNSLKSSLFLTLIGTPLHVIVSAGLAYMLSKKDLPGRKFFITVVLITMLFSAGLVPNFLVIKMLGLYDSLWAIILPGLTSAFALYVLKAFFMALPQELEDSARIDGANELQIFFTIVLPLSKAPLAAMGLFAAVGFWNTYFSAIMYLRSTTLWPLQVMLQQMVLAAGASSTTQFLDPAMLTKLKEMGMVAPPEIVRMAALVLVLAPILMVYPFVQRYFAKGVLLGSIKE